jgi:hypothetical protein
MHSTLQKLQEILNSVKYTTVKEGRISIYEKGKQASLKCIHIDSLGANALALKLDECQFPGEHLFIPNHGIRKACDAVIFCIIDDKPFILCIELKSSEPHRNDITAQFQSAHCLLDFLNSVLITYHQTNIEKWDRRYFLFHGQGKTPLAKERLVEKEHNGNNMPETALYWPMENEQKIYARKLLGKAK